MELETVYVYVVQEFDKGYPFSSEIIGIFSTEDKAIECCEKVKLYPLEGRPTDVRIEPIEFDHLDEWQITPPEIEEEKEAPLE